jgi:ion channel-forming bestrophin family protein
MTELKQILLSNRYYARNSLNWFVFLLDVGKTQTLRTLAVSVFFVGAYFGLLSYVEEYHYDIDFHLPGFVTYTLGYIMIVLYYFRLNTSYYRWYDGRKALNYLGANADSFAVKLNSYLDFDPANRLFFRNMILNHVAATNAHLRGKTNMETLNGCSEEDLQFLTKSYHLPNAIVQLMAQKLNMLCQQSIITKVQYWTLNKHLSKANELLAQCDAIRKTEPPLSYLYLIRIFLVLYTTILPFGFIHDLNAWVILMLMVYFYFYTGCEIISNEIQNPFEFDQNDLPIDTICSVMSKSVTSIFDNKQDERFTLV